MNECVLRADTKRFLVALTPAIPPVPLSPSTAATNMGRGRDAADVAMSTAFGVANLARFEVVTQEQVQAG
jgi:hypothetical protein